MLTERPIPWPILGPIRLLSLVLALAGCEDARVDEARSLGEIERKDPIPEDAGPIIEDRAGKMVRARIVTDEGTPIDGRPVVLIDARGARTEILSDEGGAFYVRDVVAPYDLAIEAAPSGSIVTPTAFLGLTRFDPEVELFERDGPASRPPSQTVRVAVRPPACPEGGCTISVVTASPTGDGAETVTYSGADAVVFALEHEWSATTLPKGETIDLHVLTADAARASFAYFHRRGIEASAGETTDLGTVAPEEVDSSPPLRVRAEGRGIPSGWAPSLATWIELPDAGSMSFGYGAVAEESLTLPMLPGGGLRVTAWLQHPAVQERPYYQAAVQAWSGVRPLTGGALALELGAGPTIIRPVAEGNLSRRAKEISWSSPAAGKRLAEVTLTDVDRGGMRWRVYTSEDSVPLKRLARLGIAAPDVGDHVLGLTATTDHSVDEIVDPDRAVRRARFDPARAGTSTYQRFRFSVTR